MPFSASIVERQFVYVPDRILKLGGASWLRKLPVSAMPWQRIRIGLLCAVTPNGTSNIADTMFTLGICSGAEYPGAAYTPLNFVGASIIGAMTVAATRTLTYNASTNGPYYSTTAGYFFAKTEGNLYSTAAVFNPVAMLSTTPATTSVYPRRTLLVLDITKPVGGSGATTMTIYGPSSTLVQTTDYRPDDLQNALDQLGTPTIRGQAMTVLSTNSTIITSPLVGEFDTMEIFWSNSQFPLEISAAGATVLAPPYYSDLGVAIDTFESYSTTSGSIPESTFLTGGSGWSATGSVTYDVLRLPNTPVNTSNLAAAPVLGVYYGTTNQPDETFEQYLTGTLNSGVTVSAGSFWTQNMTTIISRDVPAAQVYSAYVGTTNQPDDPFEQYLTGTVDSGTTINQGSYWTQAATVIAAAANPLPQVYVELVGTTFSPYDSFESYTVNNGSTTYGTTSIFTGSASVWNGTGTIYSGGSSYYEVGTTSNNTLPATGAVYGTFAYGNALYGTAIGIPYDTFEQYGSGGVVSGVTINAGTGWYANGLVATYVLA